MAGRNPAKVAQMGSSAKAGIMRDASLRRLSKVAESTDTCSRSSWLSAVGPTRTLPKIVGVTTIPFENSEGTGNTMDGTHLRAVLSRTMNCPLRGLILKGLERR